MVKNVVIVLLAVGLVGTGYWGYREHQDKNNVLNQAENNYQQSYHDLTYNMDRIHDHLGTTLATSSQDMATPELTEVWRLSSLARNDIGQLPLTLMPFNKTAEFLSNLGKFSYQTAVKNDGQKKLTDDQYHQLESLYKQSSQVEKNLRHVQQVVMDKNLRWMDVESALASQKQPTDNQVVDGLKTVDKKVQGFDNKWGPAVSRSSLDELDKLNDLDGGTISKDKAAQVVKKYVNVKNGKAKVQQLGKGSHYKAYNVTIHDEKTNNTTVASVTKNGGYLVWFIKHRTVKANKLSLHQAIQKADQFLKKHNMKNMKLVKSDQYHNIGVFTYVKMKGEVRDYPASIRMKVALDNGEVLAFDETEYLVHKKDKVTDLKPKIDKKTALKGLNKNVKVEETHLAIYENEMGKDVLCYEVLGTKGNDTYQIFINAKTGQQEKVDLLTA